MIIAEERGSRPIDVPAPSREISRRPSCPFCEGNEALTPPEKLARRSGGGAPDSPGWSVRVVANKYGALDMLGEASPHTEGFYEEIAGIGIHEVIIETPIHSERMENYSVEKLEELLTVFRDRSIELHRDRRFRYVQIFRNFGQAAGASLEHPHTQIIALPITPRWVEEEVAGARRHYETRGRCVYCDVLDHELERADRIVCVNDDCVSFTPFASRFAYETWILPRRHRHDFQFIEDGELHGLAQALHSTVWALSQVLGAFPFNVIFHSAPETLEAGPAAIGLGECYHWHIEILPRTTRVAGFEWGTGFFINTTSPEHAASRQREALEETPATNREA